MAKEGEEEAKIVTRINSLSGLPKLWSRSYINTANRVHCDCGYSSLTAGLFMASCGKSGRRPLWGVAISDQQVCGGGDDGMIQTTVLLHDGGLNELARRAVSNSASFPPFFSRQMAI